MSAQWRNTTAMISTPGLLVHIKSLLSVVLVLFPCISQEHSTASVQNCGPHLHHTILFLTLLLVVVPSQQYNANGCTSVEVDGISRYEL
mmetsp:Transcript_26874/g.49782  ORF Transcript_26874/g.49782 Transcript_26874/m.49782 type:complete len:89 (+) Transcript_26874:306-572(+)